MVPRSVPLPARDDALDRLRGLALVAMLLHHVIAWLTDTDGRELLPGWPGFVVTDVAAPAFFVAAGMSAALLVASRRRRGLPPARIGLLVIRRYGLLVPLGVGLRWVLGWSVDGFGVLEALGAAVVLAAAVAAVVPAGWELAAAGVTMLAGVVAEHAVDTAGRSDWWSVEVVGGKFPLVTYVGFALLGIAVVDGGHHRDRRWCASAAGLMVAALAALLVLGATPDRYPGDLRFVLPGLAGTAVVYALGQLTWPPVLAPFDRQVRSAAAHTLGIFLAHYALFEVADRLGVTGPVHPPVAVAAAVALALALCLAAPRVPVLPWSPRTGPRRPSGPRPPTSHDLPTAPPPDRDPTEPVAVRS